MNKQITILPSILAFDKTQTASLIKSFNDHQLNHFHYDIMDGIYVENVAFSKLEYLDHLLTNNCLVNVHLMVNDPTKWIDQLIKYKPYAISFPFELVNSQSCLALLNKIKDSNIKAGIAIHPSFVLDDYKHLLKDVDYVTFMSVVPGKCGQAFLADTYTKLNDLIAFRESSNINFEIELDGGLNFDVIKNTLNQIDYYVSGSFVVKYANNLDQFKLEINQIIK